MIDKKIIISIGSNCEPVAHVGKAKRLLEENFPGISFSEELWTKPIGMDSDDFLNLLSVADTRLPLEKVEAILKNIEKACGRTPFDKDKGVVKMDLDILLYEKIRLHEHDWQREYIVKLLALPMFEGLL